MRRKTRRIEKHQLYILSTCPYCIAVRLVLWRHGLEIPLKDILSDAGNNADLIAGGGKSQVPCLRKENEDGSIEWMYESMDIIRYIKTELVSPT